MPTVHVQPKGNENNSRSAGDTGTQYFPFPANSSVLPGAAAAASAAITPDAAAAAAPSAAVTPGTAQAQKDWSGVVGTPAEVKKARQQSHLAPPAGGAHSFASVMPAPVTLPAGAVAGSPRPFTGIANDKARKMRGDDEGAGAPPAQQPGCWDNFVSCITCRR